jgi:hypothetical protein
MALAYRTAGRLVAGWEPLPGETGRASRPLTQQRTRTIGDAGPIDVDHEPSRQTGRQGAENLDQGQPRNPASTVCW